MIQHIDCFFFFFFFFFYRFLQIPCKASILLLFKELTPLLDPSSSFVKIRSSTLFNRNVPGFLAVPALLSIPRSWVVLTLTEANRSSFSGSITKAICLWKITVPIDYFCEQDKKKSTKTNLWFCNSKIYLHLKTPIIKLSKFKMVSLICEPWSHLEHHPGLSEIHMIKGNVLQGITC